MPCHRHRGQVSVYLPGRQHEGPIHGRPLNLVDRHHTTVIHRGIVSPRHRRPLPRPCRGIGPVLQAPSPCQASRYSCPALDRSPGTAPGSPPRRPDCLVQRLYIRPPMHQHQQRALRSFRHVGRRVPAGTLYAAAPVNLTFVDACSTLRRPSQQLQRKRERYLLIDRASPR